MKAIAILSVFVLGCVVAGCAGAGAKENGEVTITVTSRGYPEEEVLREIFAQALEAAGFKVRRYKGAGLPSEELAKGRVSGYPDHLDTALTETFAEVAYVPASTKAAYQAAKNKLEGKGFVAFPPASFQRTLAVGILRKTALERGIEALTDLKKTSPQMSVVDGERFCHGPVACLKGLKRGYGIVFESFEGFWGIPLQRLYREIRTGAFDAGVLITTDGRLARGKHWLVLLEDDEHRLPAANAFWMTSQDVIDEAGPDYERAILAAQKGVTLQVMRELDAEVELEGKSPSKVAAEYLKSIHFKL